MTPCKTRCYLGRHDVLHHLVIEYPVGLRVCETPDERVCRFRSSDTGGCRGRGGISCPLVDADGAETTASRGSVASAEGRVGCATLVTLDRFLELVGGPTEALIDTKLESGEVEGTRGASRYDMTYTANPPIGLGIDMADSVRDNPTCFTTS